METYFDTHEKKDCNGCGICSLKCPKKAIKMIEDSEGFLYPIIDKEKCINCGICKKNCTNYNLKKTESECYAAYNINEEERKKSTSGGIFFSLAKYTIKNNGVVFGVCFDDNFNVKHDCAETIEECKKFMGSKYVKSDLNNSFKRVKDYLKSNKPVLFTGTPCQCNALRMFLGKDDDNLITCEIICHSNPSPKIYNLYKKYIERKYRSRIVSFEFRSKENGWKNEMPIIKLENGKIIKDFTYFKAFGRELINRPSCHNCKFSGVNRLSDFTIGDMWGIDKLDLKLKDDNSGISLLCVNTKNGKRILNSLSKELYLEKVGIADAFKYNHHNNIAANKNRKKFFEKVRKNEIDERNIRYYLNKYSDRTLIQKVISKVQKIIKR